MPQGAIKRRCLMSAASRLLTYRDSAPSPPGCARAPQAPTSAQCGHGQHVHVIRHLQGQRHVLLHQQDGEPLSFEIGDSALHLAHEQGASPSVGSSINSRSGLVMSARPIASICCSPPDSAPARLSIRSCRLTQSTAMRPPKAWEISDRQRAQSDASCISLAILTGREIATGNELL